MSTKEKSRREQILQQASLVFAEKGYRQTDIQEVADQLGIGKGTIYRNFPSKEELFLSAVEYGIKRLQEQMDAIVSAPPTQSAEEAILTGIRTYLVFFEENPEVAELLIQERAEFKQRDKPTYFEVLEQNVENSEEALRTLLEQKGLSQKLPIRSILRVISNLLYGTMFTNFFRGRQQPLEEEVEDLMVFVLSTIISGAAVQYADRDTTATKDDNPPSDDISALLSPEPDWGERFTLPKVGKGRSFVTGEPDGDRIRVRYYHRENAPNFVGKAWFGPGTEGPPGHAHGGSIAALLDEAMGASAWMAGHTVIAANINIDFRQKLPLETVAWLESWIDNIQDRKVTLRSKLFLQDGSVIAEGKGLFLKVDPKHFQIPKESLS